jgi:hypothetical protein
MSFSGVPAEAIGWLATAAVVASYFFTNPLWLRALQIGGSLLWLGYGLTIDSAPVIVANVLVFTAATWTTAARLRILRRQSARRVA